MKYYLKNDNILNKEIQLQINEIISDVFLVRELEVVGIENIKFDRFAGGDKLLNFIFKFEHNNKIIIRIYSTYSESDGRKFFNIIIDKNNSILIDGMINVLKTDTWTIEDNGSIKYGDNVNSDGDALSNIFAYYEITKKADYNIFKSDSTIEEKELLDVIYDAIQVLE